MRLLREAADMSRDLGRRVGGLTVQARYGGAVAARARKGLVAKFEREADPDGTLSEAERQRRAALLLKAHMLRLSQRSAAARRRV